jgi:hypothetical protein
MTTSKTVSEADRTVITADFSSGDYVYIKVNGHIFFGTITKSAVDEIIVEMSFGTSLYFTETSDTTLETALKSMGKPLDVNNIYEGDIISRVAKDKSGGVFREYAKIVGTYGDWGIQVEFLNGMAPGGFYTFKTDTQGTLEEKMIDWELEG